jgi:RND family efflux transporter MFP subunit
LVAYAFVCTGACADAPASGDAPADDPLPVEVIGVRLEDGYVEERTYPGTVRSRRTSFLGFERGGEVVRLHVDDGDEVAEGAPIAALDTAQLRAERRRLVAGRRRTEAGAELSTLTAGRLGRLADQTFVSEQSRDEARFGAEQARAATDEIDAAIAAIDVALRKSRLAAPFAGRVVARRADEGTVVAAGTPVVELLENDALEALVGVPPRHLAELPVGSEHELVTPRGPVIGTVQGHVADLDPRTRTTGIVFRLPAEAELVDGEVVRLGVARRGEGRGAWVPTRALTRGLRGLWSVLALDDARDQEGGGDGTAVLVRKAVEIVQGEADRSFVRGTLEDGDRIVARGLHRVVVGQRVRPLPPAEDRR